MFGKRRSPYTLGSLKNKGLAGLWILLSWHPIYLYSQNTDTVKIPSYYTGELRLLTGDSLRNDHLKENQDPVINSRIIPNTLALTMTSNFSLYSLGNYNPSNDNYLDQSTNVDWTNTFNVTYSFLGRGKSDRYSKLSQIPISAGIQFNYSNALLGFNSSQVDSSSQGLIFFGPSFRVQPFMRLQEFNYRTYFLSSSSGAQLRIWNNTFSIYQHLSSWLMVYSWLNGQMRFHKNRRDDYLISYGIMGLIKFYRKSLFFSIGYSSLNRRIRFNTQRRLFWKYSYERNWIVGLYLNPPKRRISVFANYSIYPSFCEFFRDGVCNHITGGVEKIPGSWHNISIGMRYLIRQ